MAYTPNNTNNRNAWKNKGKRPPRQRREEEAKDPQAIMNRWIPRTGLGRDVKEGNIKSIREIFEKGMIIKEPEIVDILIPKLSEEIMLVGGTPGKGGGKKRTPMKATTRMHEAGRRRTIHTFVCIGNGDGLVGYSYTKGKDMLSTLNKARRQAKLSIFPIRRGCGSWECQCRTNHSIPFTIQGKCGSVKVKILPAPKGLKLCADSEMKKVLKLAGIKDVWIKSYGQTGTTINFIFAIIDAFKNLNAFKVNDNYIKSVGLDQINK